MVEPPCAAPRRGAPTGLIWPNDRKVAELAPWLDRLTLIALTFPNFRDGCAYTQARQLRERYGFRGDLRATGEILRDQFLFLIRAGFDSLEVKKAADAAACLAPSPAAPASRPNWHTESGVTIRRSVIPR